MDPDFQRGASLYNRAQGWAKHCGPNPALGQNGAPISGLCVIGNDAVSIMGGHYPSGGTTLGQGMTFGYVVGRRIKRQPIKGQPIKGLTTSNSLHTKAA